MDATVHSLAVANPGAIATPSAAPLRNLDHEHAFQPLRVEGRLPADLCGTFLRNGPARFDIGTRPHWFDGTGAVSAVRLDGSGATGAVRITHTPSIDFDQTARSPRYGGFRQPFSRRQSLAALFGGKVVRNAANINLLPWQGRLFALHETTLPVELDPDSLQGLGETNLGGVIPGAWNAHPHRVAANGTVYQFGVRIGRRVALDVFALPRQGAARLLTTVGLPGVMEVHDFFATENHLIFVLPPLWCSSLALLRTRSFVEALRWRVDQPATVLVIPLAQPDQVQRIDTDAFFFWHSINAFERNGGCELVLDLIAYPDFNSTKQTLDAISDGVTNGAPAASVQARGSSVRRGVVDRARGQIRWEQRWDTSCEFPAVHRDVQGRRHRYAWLASANGGSTSSFTTLTRLDIDTGTACHVRPGRACAVSEPGLVARSEREDDVYLLSLIQDNAAGASWLGVWDGAHLDDEPLARIWFDQLLPPPLHGCWMPAATH